MKWKAITIYADPQALKRQARKWAKQVEETSAVRVAQPQSAYVRYLIAKDAKAGK